MTPDAITAEPKASTGALEAFALSLSIVAPTLAMSFNTPLSAGAVGRVVPLTFALGGVAMIPVALSFLAFARRVVDAGSAQAYVGAVLGLRSGFLAGWLLLLCYLTFAAGALILVGTFMSTAVAHSSLPHPPWFIWVAIAALMGSVLARRRLSTLTRLMMIFEGVAMLAVLGLVAVIIVRSPGSLAPFVPQPGLGVAGMGSGMVFAVLAFAGFEGAATLSEETRRPGRSIPLAMLGALGAATLFYVVVSYAEVIGFGPDHAQALAGAAAPLDTLSTQYIAGAYGSMLDLAAAVGAFAFVLAATTAAARLLYALGRAGLSLQLAVRPQDGVPGHALWTAGAVELALVVVAIRLGGPGSSGALLTIGTLALILVYMAVGLSHAVASGRSRRLGSCLVGVTAILCLSWPLLASIYPVADWPADLWPVAVLAWLAAGIVLMHRHAGSTRRGLVEGRCDH